MHRIRLNTKWKRTVMITLLFTTIGCIYLFSHQDALRKEKLPVSDIVRANKEVEKPTKSDSPWSLQNETNKSLTPEEVDKIKMEVRALNCEQKIYNVDKFGPVNEKTQVVLVQVHTRADYLGQLVKSLSKNRNIENSLIIFSHDVFIPGLNDVIQKIDFARVMQIFYPHSIQLHPDTFPGQSPDDCPVRIELAKAKVMNCTNADHPDVSGKYREARYTQMKHHWWWKANFVFEKLRVLQNYTGVIAFLEEDHYVAPDFLWILSLMEGAMIRGECHGCDTLAAGQYVKTLKHSQNSSYSIAEAKSWTISNTNTLVFNRTTFDKLRECAKTFCEYDDYNWDWTLVKVSNSCLKKPLDVLFPSIPRMFHMGVCGFHHQNKDCDASSVTQGIEEEIRQRESLFFPESLTVERGATGKKFIGNGNGGWGDLRDKNLCMSFVDSP